MAAKDIAEKLLEEHNDVFADIFKIPSGNSRLFNSRDESV